MTQVAMPPTAPMPSLDKADEEAPFKVLNQDNLPMVITGDAIFKPFLDANKRKPNGIVYPTRRNDLNSLQESKQKQLAKSNGHLPGSNESAKSFRNKSKLSASQGNLRAQITESGLDFTKTLDAKLRKLQKENRKNGKKPFVTTVKKGVFLEAPEATKCAREVEEIKPAKKQLYYAYSSKPMVLNRVPQKAVHRSRCEAAAIAAGCALGSVIDVAQDDVKDSVDSKNKDVPMPYANLMFERRVVRGSNFAPQTLHQGDGESAAARAAIARRRAIARKKARLQTVRAAQLRLGSPPAIKGRKHEPVQTDLYLEEIFATPSVTDMCTQTELFLERPLSPFYVPSKTGEDAETQIYPGDLFDFDMEVQPILEVLVGKTVEQALIEVLEEEELAALKEQQRKFLEIRAAEACEAQRIIEKEKRLQREKEKRIKDYEEGIIIQKEMEERIAASVLMQGYLADLLPSVLEGLESEGVLLDQIKEDIDNTFMPWLMKEVTTELEDIVSSRDILSDIVREILENRAETYTAIYEMQKETDSISEYPVDMNSENIKKLVYGDDVPRSPSHEKEEDKNEEV